MYRHFRLYLFLFFFTCLTGSIAAQQFGGNPSSVKWKQINTDTVRIIFPEGLDSTAQRVAAVAHHLQQYNAGSIGGAKRKIDVVLQHQVIFANGYVGLGPYRSEFYLMPPQNALELGGQRWADNLAIHEFRHVQQYGNFRHGVSKLMSVLFGQDGQAVANAAAVPDWFFEGDAVYNETLLSGQGRGRLPSFFNGYKSLWYANRQYSYMKLRNGSFRQYVPDHYRLGYLLVAYGREKYGDSFWREVTQDAVRFKPLFYPFQGAVRRYTGISYDRFVADALHWYQMQWEHQPADSVQWMTATRTSDVVNYQYPYTTANGSLIVLRNSNKQIPAFYELLPEGGERKIAVRDIAYDNYFSYNNGKIAYAAYQADTRWGNKENSVIRILDVQTGEARVLTRNTRYFSPDIAHNGARVVTTEYTADQHSRLVVLDESGKVIRTRDNKEGHVYAYPKFSANDQLIYWINRNETGQMSIESEPVAGGEVATVLPFANRLISYPVIQGDTLLYTCSNNGNDEIWAYVPAAKQHFRLATYETGLYQAVLDKHHKLVSSVFTADGYRLGRFVPSWQQVGRADTLKPLYVQQPFRPAFNNTLPSIGTGHYPVSKYRKATGLFNFHSWQPDYSDPEYSFTIYGENVLNTLQSQLYYVYNENDGSSRVGYTGTYGGWYVQPFAGVSQTWQRNVRYNNDTTLYWNETVARAGLRLPLTFSGGKQYRSLVLSSSYNLANARWTGLAKGVFRERPLINYLESRIQYSEQIQAAAQHIYPHWAKSVLLQYRNLLNPSLKAAQFLASGSIYLPGVAASHSLVLTGSWQSRDTAGDYSYSSGFPFSRGYQAIDFPRMWRVGINYHLPLWLPDWGLGQVVYFKRIRTNLFYDLTGGRSVRTGITNRFGTAGAELYFDTRWWNQHPVTFGLRYSRLLDKELLRVTQNVWEIIWPVNLFNR